MLNVPAQGEKCEAIRALILDSEELMQETTGSIRDMCMIAAGQAIEHYEITQYGTLSVWAHRLGMIDASRTTFSTKSHLVPLTARLLERLMSVRLLPRMDFWHKREPICQLIVRQQLGSSRGSHMRYDRRYISRREDELEAPDGMGAVFVATVIAGLIIVGVLVWIPKDGYQNASRHPTTELAGPASQSTDAAATNQTKP
jgi:hypothetical protein